MKWTCVTLEYDGSSKMSIDSGWADEDVEARRQWDPSRLVLDLPGLVVVSRIAQLGWFVYIREDLIGG